MLALESDNFIYGRAENPWNRNRVVGGSSGGEAGLVAARGSNIGLATDSLGSIRLPAAWCGVYSLNLQEEEPPPLEWEALGILISLLRLIS
jgi:Asp-tRNA(Asn)/Glu-tRNA(Gln) amidotransferase A subunit family amidase